MADVDLNVIAEQLKRVLEEQASMRDDIADTHAVITDLNAQFKAMTHLAEQIIYPAPPTDGPE